MSRIIQKLFLFDFLKPYLSIKNLKEKIKITSEKFVKFSHWQGFEHLASGLEIQVFCKCLWVGQMRLVHAEKYESSDDWQ